MLRLFLLRAKIAALPQPVPRHGDTTFKVMEELVMPFNEAEIIAVPAATPVAEVFEPVPELLVKIVAILVLELIQVTWEVISDIEPSE
jgi:hypothetical protein